MFGSRIMRAVPAAALVCTTAVAQEAGSVSDGQAIARETCSECHAVEPDDVISPNMDAPAFQDVADRHGMSAMALTVWFRTPHPTMPNFVFDALEADDLAAYILSLKTR